MPQHPRLWRRRGASASTPAIALMLAIDLRETQAGRAAGMLTIAAAWSYLGEW
ncbi:MAG: hypothetical protein IPP50_22325 [Piscinibacter sp.]|nr:hypothetical protein [Piscinibacter sp.]